MKPLLKRTLQEHIFAVNGQCATLFDAQIPFLDNRARTGNSKPIAVPSLFSRCYGRCYFAVYATPVREQQVQLQYVMGVSCSA